MEANEYKIFAVDSFNKVEEFTRAFINNDSIKIVNDDNLTDMSKHIYSFNDVLKQIADKAKSYADIFAL